MTNSLIDLPGVCASFPSRPEPEILREAYLQAINERVFEGGKVDVAVVTGEEGAGKTTFMAQMARQAPDRTISLFVRGSSPTAYDPALATRDIANQIHWALNRSDLPEDQQASLGLVNQLLFSLNRSSHRSDTEFRFMVDGLHEVQDDAVLEQLLDLVPIGAYSFQCVLSDRDGRVQSRLRSGVRAKEVDLLSFSRPEVESLLSRLSLSTDELEDVWTITRGNPGRVGQIAHLIEGGTSARDVLDRVFDSGGPFETEWERVSNDESLLDLYGVLAFDLRQNTVDSLARILGREAEEVEAEASRSSLLELNGMVVEFGSQAVVKHVKKELESRASRVREKVIADLSEGDALAARFHLPEIYFEAGRYLDVLEALRPEPLQEIASAAGSVAMLQRFVNYGRLAAEKTGRQADSLHFSLDESLLREFRQLRVWAAEMEAHLAHGDYDRALEIAQSAVLDEERLFLLGRLSAKMVRDGEVIEPEIEAQVRSLYARVDFRSGGVGALEVAEHLVYLCPDLAVDLVERTSGLNDDENSLDASLALLTVMAAGDDREEGRDMRRQLQDRIEDPHLREMARGFSSMVEFQTAKEVIRQLETVGSVSGRLYLLRHWIRENLTAPDAVEASKYGLELAVQSPGYSPNAKVATDLAAPLPFIDSAEAIREVVHLLDVQRAGLKQLGPTADYIELRLVIAEALVGVDDASAGDRILDVLLEVEEYPDPVTKVRGLCQILSTLLHVADELTDPLDLRQRVEDQVSPLIDDLLDRSAEQYVLVRPILRAFAHVDLERALHVARALNTQPRRDRAVRETIAHAARSQGRPVDWGRVRGALDQIVSQRERDRGIWDTVFALKRRRELPGPEEILPVLRLVPSVEGAGRRCRLLVESLRISRRQGGLPDSLEGDWLASLRQTWGGIETLWVKVEAAYGIARDLATAFPTEAKRYLELADAVRRTAVLDTHDASATYNTAVRVAIRSFEGLISSGVVPDDEYGHLIRLIEREASIGERLMLLNELAIAFVKAGKREEAHDITAGRIRPLLGRLSTEDRAYRDAVLSDVAVALYLDHSGSALELVEDLHAEARDLAITNIIHFKLTKFGPNDAYQGDEGRPDLLEVTDLQDACSLLQHFSADAPFFGAVSRIAATLGSKSGRVQFNHRIQLDIADRLREAVSQSLPKKGYIPHDGYALACQAVILRLRHEAKDRSLKDWSRLISAVNEIGNEADRVFVSALVLEQAPHSVRRNRTEWIKGLAKAAQALPLPADRQTRLHAVGEALQGFDQLAAKAAYQSALLTVGECSNDDGDQDEAWSRYRSILDAAHDLDADFAASLASLSDDRDDLRKYRESVRQYLEKRELRRSLSEPAKATPPALQSDGRALVEAAWGALGSLNAGRAPAQSPESILPLFGSAASLPLREAYPAFALIIQNLTENLVRSSLGESRLKELFRRAVDSADVAHHVLARAKNQADQSRKGPIDSSPASGVNVLAGELEKATDFIRAWAASTVRHYLKIIDPYFGPDEMVWFRTLGVFDPEVGIQILARESRQKQVIKGQSFPEAYRASWKELFDVSAPPIEVTLVHATEGANPLHERLVLTDGSGLRFGTSFNSLGRTVDATISRLSRGESAALEAEYDRFFSKERRPTPEVVLRYAQFQV